MLFTTPVHCSVRLVKNWCRVSNNATKNCDFASGYKQFAGYNTLFYNPDANPIKPNTNSNPKTYLAYVNYTISAQPCYRVVTIRYPHDTIRIAILGSRYDTYRDTC